MSQVRLATRSDNIKLSMPFPSRSQFLRRSVCPSTKSAEFLDRVPVLAKQPVNSTCFRPLTVSQRFENTPDVHARTLENPFRLCDETVPCHNPEPFRMGWYLRWR